jgi:uncharacterized protein YndB with AHSA1/START domain
MVDIIHRIGIKSPVAQVYEALATIKGVSSWWTTDVIGDSRKGGQIQVRFKTVSGQEMGAMKIDVLSLESEKLVHWRFSDGPPEWINTELTFTLKQEADMTIVILAHKKWREAVEFTAHCSMKWATFLLSLRESIETGKGRLSPHDFKIDNWN